MTTLTRRLQCALAAACILASLFTTPALAQAAARQNFSICWTIYAGWMPWGEAKAQGIIDKWARKYGIRIDVVQLNDYVESINQYTAGRFDGCAMTNMDALTIPAAGGVDSTALIVSDYSNGNDGLVVKGKGRTLASLKGQPIHLAEFSVSHYLLARALESAGLRERDVRVVNTSDADIAAAFATPPVRNIVTWNPMLAEAAAQPDTAVLFDSSSIPGEIMDMMVVNTRTLRDNPALGKALTGAWFEMVAAMERGESGNDTLAALARASGTSLANYRSQLGTTRLFYTPQEALAFVTGKDVPVLMGRVADFLFSHGLLGPGARGADAIGMEFAGGAVLGNPANIKLRFDPAYVRLAAEGKL